MSITDELREIISEIDFATNRDRLRAIADLIDMRHELGRGTCEMVDIPDGWEDADGTIWPDSWVCDSCGVYTYGMSTQPDIIRKPRYCPNCGRKVVDDASVE